ncbi:MAG: DUF6314 family protein [Pikeienuella sp.]
MTLATKAGLLGMWRIDRRIIDARGADGAFCGSAVFSQCPDDTRTLLFSETGTLHIGSQKPVVATRNYQWHFPDQRRIDVRFADGRDFHSFDSTSVPVTAVHHCAPDIYRVEYTFTSPTVWLVKWRVTGPRKDYEMISEMTRPPNGT